MRKIGFALLLVVLAFTSLAFAQTPGESDPKKEEARAHFELGLAHFDRGEYSAALAEFLRAREIFPSRGATKNAAICLRKENRFDEALEMFEKLLVEFPDLSPTDRQLVDKEISELRVSIGTVTIDGAPAGATIVIDARSRGTTPLSLPLRVGTGSHLIRIVKDGYLPFEQRFELAGQQSLTIKVSTQPLTQSGGLSIVEKNGKALPVYVDGVLVGNTPWHGAVQGGTHVVILKGEDNIGTQPTNASVDLGGTNTLTLEAAALDGLLRIDPVPAGASVALDGVTLGHGVWEGRLFPGDHRVEVADEGFLTSKQSVKVGKERLVLRVELDRDLSSPMWKTKLPPHAFAELTVGPVLGALGGDITNNCNAPCSASLPLGLRPVLRIAYQLTSGVEFGFDAGGVFMARSVAHRTDADLIAVGGARSLSPDATDSMTLSAATLGVHGGIVRGETLTFAARLGLGVLFGVASVTRAGTYTSSKGETFNIPADTGPLKAGLGAAYLSITPELRLGWRPTKHFELSIGAEAGFHIALLTPRWPEAPPPGIIAGKPPSTGDGLATAAGESVMGGFVFLLTPNVGLRWDF